MSGLVSASGTPLNAYEKVTPQAPPPNVAEANSVKEMAERLTAERAKHLEIFAAAFLTRAPKSLHPANAMLVERRVGPHAFTWFFTPRDVPVMPREVYEALMEIITDVARNGGRSPFATKARELAPMMRQHLADLNQMREEAEAAEKATTDEAIARARAAYEASLEEEDADTE